MKRTVLLAAACIVLAGLLWLAWAFLRDYRLHRNFDKIRTGASEREVVQMLGEPTRVENCGDSWGPFPKAELEGCVKEFFYASPFAIRRLRTFETTQPIARRLPGMWSLGIEILKKRQDR